MIAAATVTNLDDERMIREGEAAVELYIKDIKDAHARILPMARGLLAAKRKYPATQDYGDWLKTSPYNGIGPTDRAALTHIGEHAYFAIKVMRHVESISPRVIWDAICDLLPTSPPGNSTETENIPSETDATASTTPESPLSDSQKVP